MLLPITISFLFTENEPVQLQRICYFLNLFLCSFTYWLILVVIFYKKNNFYAVTEKKEINKIKTSAVLDTIAILLVVILVIFNQNWFYAPFFLPGAIKFISKRTSKKASRKVKPVEHLEQTSGDNSH